jgi:DNA processing protein
MDELIATVAILKSDVVSAPKLCALLEYFGSAVDLLPRELGGAQIELLPMMLNAIGFDQIRAAKQQVDEWRHSGYYVRTVLDPLYPSNLQAVFDKPPLLFILGQWVDELDSRAVAIVGTRNPSDDGRKRAFKLAKAFASAGVTVLSGLAKGIDASAHRGALDAGGRTVAVLGTGVTRRYPRENTMLADDILAAGGALLSQFFPLQPPTKWTFPVRNLTMSGLSLATVVIEAGVTSGAKMQAEAALVHGRPVFLPTSLVRSHEWARNLVERGHRGALAIEVASADDVIDRLEHKPEADAIFA